MKFIKLIMSALAISSGVLFSDACSRVVYIGQNNITLVGRTLDWRNPIPTNIYVYPSGMAKVSMPHGPRLEWTSCYGSVLAVSYDGGVTEGINTEGLCMNGLFCKVSTYPTTQPSTGGELPVMSLAVLVSYFLDNFATVDEADAWLQNNKFIINGETFDGGTVALLHWAITDRSGQTMVLEYMDGHLNTYRGSDDLTVLTNDPALPDMRAINAYWTKKGGTNTLPGTVSSPDRFVRASFFINHVPKDVDYDAAFAAVSSIMGTVSVPFGYAIEGEPNVSSTQWTSMCDLTGGKYYMRFADSTGNMWIDMGRLRFNPGAPVLKIDTSNHFNLIGCVNDKLVQVQPFTPMW